MARSSTITNAITPATPAPPATRTSGENHPASAVCERAKTIAPRLVVASAAPRRAHTLQRSVPASGAMSLRAAITRPRPTGTLIRKIACQPTSSVSAPPSMTPIAAPAPPTAPQAARACARGVPLRKVLIRIERQAGGPGGRAGHGAQREHGKSGHERAALPNEAAGATTEQQQAPEDQ